MNGKEHESVTDITKVLTSVIGCLNVPTNIMTFIYQDTSFVTWKEIIRNMQEMEIWRHKISQ